MIGSGQFKAAAGGGGAVGKHQWMVMLHLAASLPSLLSRRLSGTRVDSRGATAAYRTTRVRQGVASERGDTVIN